MVYIVIHSLVIGLFSVLEMIHLNNLHVNMILLLMNDVEYVIIVKMLLDVKLLYMNHQIIYLKLRLDVRAINMVIMFRIKVIVILSIVVYGIH